MDAQDPMDTVRGLAGFTGRGAGSDAERRAATWLAAQVAAAGHQVELETFWSRPNWALTHLWHVGLAVAGSLIALASPITGVVLLAVALVSVTADAISVFSLGRRLTPERASQNLVATVPREPPASAPPSRLVLTANYDAGRVGLAYRLRPATTRLTRLTRGLTPGWIGWIWLATVWLLAIAILRETGHTSHLIGAIQLPPTVGLLLGFAVLLDLALADWAPAASDNATGVAAVLEIANALSAAPPQHLQVNLVLTGAGDAEQIGLHRYLRAQRRRQTGTRRRWPSPRRTADMIVLGFAPCGGGIPRWWQSDGVFIPLRYSARLRRTASQIAEDEPHLRVAAHRGRGNTPAQPARIVGLPALTIGCLDANGLSPHSHEKADVADSVERAAIDRSVQFALLLIDRIDAALAADQGGQTATPA
jgi:hypothetical protein